LCKDLTAQRGLRPGDLIALGGGGFKEEGGIPLRRI